MSEEDAEASSAPSSAVTNADTAALQVSATPVDLNPDPSDDAETAKKPVSVGRRVWVVSRLFTSVLLLVFIALICWPAQWGGPVTFAIVSGTSMEPEYHTGDVVVAVKSPDAYKVGDIIVYTVHDGDLKGGVVHRIVRELPDGNFLTQGDNKPYTDPWEVQPDWISGKVQIMIPQGAKALLIMRSPIFLSVIVGLLVSAALWPRGSTEDKDDEEGADEDEEDEGNPEELDKGDAEASKRGPNPPETAPDPASASSPPPPNTS